MTPDIPKLQRIAALSKAFTPSAPVSSRDLFSGRMDEVFSVISALEEPGRQVVIYGERGVGKTSLANLITRFTFTANESPDKPSFRINCHTEDNFSGIWRRVFREAGYEIPDHWKLGSPEPDDVRLQLSRQDRPSVLVLDEFDRIEDDETLSLMADTIKAISDHALDTRIVIVGVAGSIDELIGEHESVQRAIQEVLIPRMTRADMSEIISSGAERAQLEFLPEAASVITRLAEGLPHYVHLLALNAGKVALHDDRDAVTRADVTDAAKEAVGSHSLMRDYQMAVQSPRPESLFVQVLTACALAEKNMLGQFTSAAVREPMTRVMGKHYDIPAFSNHLNQFTRADRGSVLVKEGVERRYTYRFRNPLLQPFSLMRAIADGVLPADYQADLLGRVG